MAYDRYDTRHDPRDERSRWRDERSQGRDGGEDRGFFERAGDEIASWFGDDDADRRRRQEQRMEGRDRDWRRDDDRGRFSGRGPDDDRSRSYGRDREFERGRSERDDDRGGFFAGRDEYRFRPGGFGGSGSERRSEPMFGGYTAAESLGDSEDFPPRRRAPWGEDARGGDFATRRDPHYHAWRQRQLDELDRDYDDYRRENQSRFESDFGSWRERRMQKRGLLGQIREHMEVVGSDDAHVGTVDRVAGDRLILAKSDGDSGGVHHSLSCADIDRVDGDRVILECGAEQAKQRWRDESRSRALFEREDQGEMGDRALNRSFQGTYR